MERFRWTMAAALSLVGVLLAGGCEDDDWGGKWRFENVSSHQVYVAPNGQDWSAATISPDSSVTVDYTGDRIQYVYTPSNRVRPERMDVTRSVLHR